MDTAKVTGRAYLPRVIDRPLSDALAAAGAVVIEGARASGKTMTALHAAESYVFLDDPDTQTLLEVSPAALLVGDRPRLLDEWQLAPQLWNMVRRAVDGAAGPRQFILTGSAVPADDVTRHTGAGRFLRLRQRTMSGWEHTGAGAVSLAMLFAGDRPAADMGVADVDEVIGDLLRPGFPAMTDLTHTQSAARLRAYADDVARVDVPRIAEVRHEPDLLRQLLRAVARGVAGDVNHRTLAADLRAAAPSITPVTVGRYLELLERLFVIEKQLPWTPKLRSRARLRTSPKLHMVDPALAAAVLGAGRSQLRADLATAGVLFESAVVHDLWVYADALGGEVRHYRDSNGREIDAVVTLPDGRWGAVEVKLGAGRLQDAIDSLNRVIAQIDTDAVGDPAFRLVVTGTGPTLVADEGTVTCPLRALRP